jgi:hypothetical protein
MRVKEVSFTAEEPHGPQVDPGNNQHGQQRGAPRPPRGQWSWVVEKWVEHQILQLEKGQGSQALWLKPVILATWEAEVRKIMFQVQPRKKVSETPSQPRKVWVWW